MKQLRLLRKEKGAYGGELLKTRRGRSEGRPLSERSSMHLVLRSSKAKGDWSFRKAHNARAVQRISRKLAHKYGVKIYSAANVGNHLHMHIKLSSRHTYYAFIRGMTAAIAMAITGVNRNNPFRKGQANRFWDYRPFTRVIESFRAFLNMKDYIRINQLEGFGYHRDLARFIMRQDPRPV